MVTPHPDVLQYLDDPDSQEFPIQKKEFTVRESRHTAAGADRKGSKDTEEKGDIESGRRFNIYIKVQKNMCMKGHKNCFKNVL